MRERLVAMTTISELLRGAGFDQKTVEVICEAYIKARKSSRDTNHADLVNEIIARRILSLAKRGERDPDQLRAKALASSAFGSDAIRLPLTEPLAQRHGAHRPHVRFRA